MADRTTLRGARVVVTGADGQLGRFLVPALVAAGARPVGFGHRESPGVDRVVDVTDARAVADALAGVVPDFVVHAAAYTDVDGCERDPARADAVNRDGAANLAAAAAAAGAHLVMVSTDFVFAGDGGAPYPEDAPTDPISVYGRSKRDGELAVLATNPGFAVARTAWLYGGAGKHFPRTILTLLRDRGTVEVVTDEAGSPTFAGDLAGTLVALIAARAAGVFHLANAGRASRFAFARAVAQEAGLDPERVRPTTSAAFLAKYPLPARRPADSTLANRRAAALGIALRPWEEAVAEYVPRLTRELGIRPDDRQPVGDPTP